MKKAFFRAFFLLSPIEQFVCQKRVRDYAFLVSLRPDTFAVHSIQTIAQCFAVELNKVFSKPFKFPQPFFFGDKRTRTDNEDRSDFTSGLEFSQDKTRLNRFTDTDTVSNKQARSLRSNKAENWPELIRNKIDTSRFQRVQR